MKEAVIQRQIMRMLGYAGVVAWRQGSGMIPLEGRMFRSGTPGCADISGILIGGRRLEIEVKGKRGKLRPDQVKFGRRVTRLGGLYLVMRDKLEATDFILRYYAEVTHDLGLLGKGIWRSAMGIPADSDDDISILDPADDPVRPAAAG